MDKKPDAILVESEAVKDALLKHAKAKRIDDVLKSIKIIVSEACPPGKMYTFATPPPFEFAPLTWHPYKPPPEITYRSVPPVQEKSFWKRLRRIFCRHYHYVWLTQYGPSWMINSKCIYCDHSEHRGHYTVRNHPDTLDAVASMTYGLGFKTKFDIKPSGLF